MSMGYAANFAEVIEQEFVKKQCPEQFEKFNSALDENQDETLESFAQNAEDLDEKSKEGKTYIELCEAFEKKTGLSLYISYHDPDNGDTYDDVNGVMWCVDGVYELTPAGKKHQKQIQRVSWVSFG
jgi:hypothetical protein